MYVQCSRVLEFFIHKISEIRNSDKPSLTPSHQPTHGNILFLDYIYDKGLESRARRSMMIVTVVLAVV